MVPFQVDISKISRNIGIQRPTTLKYMKNLEEAKLIRRLFTNLDSISDLQKPDKILLDNPNLICTLSSVEPEIGTLRESYFCNQLSGAGHQVEYGGITTGDFRIDKNIVIEVGGPGKSFEQIRDIDNSFLAIDGVEFGRGNKIPLWLFGFLY